MNEYDITWNLYKICSFKRWLFYMLSLPVFWQFRNYVFPTGTNVGNKCYKMSAGNYIFAKETEETITEEINHSYFIYIRFHMLHRILS